ISGGTPSGWSGRRIRRTSSTPLPDLSLFVSKLPHPFFKLLLTWIIGFAEGLQLRADEIKIKLPREGGKNILNIGLILRSHRDQFCDDEPFRGAHSYRLSKNLTNYCPIQYVSIRRNNRPEKIYNDVAVL